MSLKVTIPDDLAKEFLQMIRDFDTKHDPNHEDKVTLQVFAEGGLTVEEMSEILDSMTPKMEHKCVVRADAE